MMHKILLAFEPIPILSVALMIIVFNAIWYAPFAFGKLWLRYHRRLNKKLPEAKSSIAFTLCTQLITFWIINALQAGLGITDLYDGALLGLVIGLGLIGPFSAANAVYFGLPIRLWAMDFAHHLLGLTIASAVLGAFH